MNTLLTNWKTTVAGVVLIVVGVLNAAFGIHVPGFTMDVGAALASGIGLIMAKDGNVTGGTVKQ